MQEFNSSNSAETVDRFLDQIAVRLKSRFSPFEVSDTLEELRSHLAASIRAYEELGLDSEESTRAAIQAFGDPQKLAERIAHEAKPSNTWQRAALAAACGAVGGLVGAAFMATLVITYCLTHGERFGGIAQGFAVLAMLGAGYGVLSSARPLSPRQSATVGATIGSLGAIYFLVLGVSHGAHNLTWDAAYFLGLWAGGGITVGWVTTRLYKLAIRYRVRFSVSVTTEVDS